MTVRRWPCGPGERPTRVLSRRDGMAPATGRAMRHRARNRGTRSEWQAVTGVDSVCVGGDSEPCSASSGPLPHGRAVRSRVVVVGDRGGRRAGARWPAESWSQDRSGDGSRSGCPRRSGRPASRRTPWPGWSSHTTGRGSCDHCACRSERPTLRQPPHASRATGMMRSLVPLDFMRRAGRREHGSPEPRRAPEAVIGTAPEQAMAAGRHAMSSSDAGRFGPA